MKHCVLDYFWYLSDSLEDCLTELARLDGCLNDHLKPTTEYTSIVTIWKEFQPLQEGVAGISELSAETVKGTIDALGGGSSVFVLRVVRHV